MGRVRLGLLGLAVTATFGGAPPARAGGEDALALLAWPATTRTITPRGWTPVWAEPRKQHLIGTLRTGARVAWTEVVAGDKRCKVWLGLAPRGYVCAKDVKPSDDVATTTGDDEEPLGTYADIRGDQVDAYDTVAEIRAGTPSRSVPGTTFVVMKKNAVRIDGVRYQKTDQGYVAVDDLSWRTPSQFTGVDLVANPPPGWPFAWVLPARRGKPTPIVDGPGKKAKKVGEVAPRGLVAVLEQQGKATRIADGEWIDSARLRIARVTAPPAGLGEHERWIDVDLEQQVLVAYEGATPVYATMVSSGKKKDPTPTGIYRIAHKSVRTRMKNPSGTEETWDVADVPWSMEFRKYFALHGAYWHDGFGTRRSHGCINLSPGDAHFLYGWTTPDVPDGWHEFASADGEGTVVRVHDHWNPDPPWRSYDGKVIDGPAGTSTTPATTAGAAGR